MNFLTIMNQVLIGLILLLTPLKLPMIGTRVATLIGSTGQASRRLVFVCASLFPEPAQVSPDVLLILDLQAPLARQRFQMMAEFVFECGTQPLRHLFGGQVTVDPHHRAMVDRDHASKQTAVLIFAQYEKVLMPAMGVHFYFRQQNDTTIQFMKQFRGECLSNIFQHGLHLIQCHHVSVTT